MNVRSKPLTWMQAGAEWLGMPGYGFGLFCPAIVGTIRIKMPEFWRLHNIQAELSGRMQVFRAKPAPDPNAPLFIIDTILRWVAGAQMHHQLPAFSQGKVLSSRKRSGGVTDYIVAIPGSRMQTTAKVLSWVLSEFQTCLAGEKENPEASDVLQELLAGHKTTMVNSFRFLTAACELGIPFQDIGGGIYAFGTGYRRRMLRSSFTDATPAIGVQLADYKNLTASILKRSGLPGATHILVADEAQAIAAGHKLGFPVVVKPADKEQGIGVAAGLVTDKALANAYREAKKHTTSILIEKHAPGRDYRLTVFNGRVIKTVNLVPGGVTGDGENTIEQLLKLTQQEEHHLRRARERGRPLLVLDSEAKDLLIENGLTPHSVPAVDEYIPLRRRANISAGGTSVLVPPDKIHPDNLQLAERAAAVLGLDLAGIDLLIEDISRSWQEIGGLICEVNAQPQIGLGTSPKIYQEILSELVPGEPRIPAVLVVSREERVDWDLVRQLWSLNERLGLATTEGAWIGRKRIMPRPDNAYAAGAALFFDRGVTAAMVVMNVLEIRRYGLPADRFGLVIFDDPEHWSDEERQAAGEAILLLTPHASAIAALEPKHPCLQAHLMKDKLMAHETEKAGSPWSAFGRVMRNILVPQGIDNYRSSVHLDAG